MVQEIVKGATFNGVNGAKRQKRALIVRSAKKNGDNGAKRRKNIR